jgi:hypothetical protein
MSRSPFRESIGALWVKLPIYWFPRSVRSASSPLNFGAAGLKLQVVSTITISLPDEDLAFLKRLSAAEGTSVGEFFARQARSVRKQLEQPLPPDIIAASGIIGADADSQNGYLKHAERKYL